MLCQRNQARLIAQDSADSLRGVPATGGEHGLRRIGPAARNRRAVPEAVRRLPQHKLQGRVVVVGVVDCVHDVMTMTDAVPAVNLSVHFSLRLQTFHLQGIATGIPFTCENS